MEQKTLAITLRNERKKGASRRLRRSGKIPSVIYGHNEPVSIAVDELEFNKKLVRDYAAEEDAGGTAFLDKYVDPDFVFYYPNGTELRGMDNLRKAVAEMQKGFPDLNHVIHDQIAEGDKVATRYTMTGTHNGEFNGIAPTGKELKMTVIDICRISDGKVVEAWVEFDGKAFEQVLNTDSPSEENN